MEDQKYPRGAEFAPFLCSFMNKYLISIDELAKAMFISRYTVTRLSKGKSFPTDACYVEFCLMFTVVSGKSFDAYKKISRKDKKDFITKILASGGSSVITAGGMIGLISVSGIVPGLSAAGVTSGLAAIGAMVGGGMVAGIASVALAPIAVGIGVIFLVHKILHKEKTSYFIAYEDELDPIYEVNPTAVRLRTS